MNRTIREATVKRFHCDDHDQLCGHLADVISACNFGRRLKTRKGLAPYEFIWKQWTIEPERFTLNTHQMQRLHRVVIRWLYGRMRIGGNIIWATDFREEVNTTSQGGGKGGKVKTTEDLNCACFAVALCEGPITGIGRVGAVGKAMDLGTVTRRWCPGCDVQTADPLSSTKMGVASTPADRGTAYVHLEELHPLRQPAAADFHQGVPAAGGSGHRRWAGAGRLPARRTPSILRRMVSGHGPASGQRSTPGRPGTGVSALVSLIL